MTDVLSSLKMSFASIFSVQKNVVPGQGQGLSYVRDLMESDSMISAVRYWINLQIASNVTLIVALQILHGIQVPGARYDHTFFSLLMTNEILAIIYFYKTKVFNKIDTKLFLFEHCI